MAKLTILEKIKNLTWFNLIELLQDILPNFNKRIENLEEKSGSVNNTSSVNEAPEDGTQYGRQNGTWTIIENAGSTALQPGDNISLLTNNVGYITIANLPDTKSEYNNSLIDGDFLFVGDITQYTDVDSQNAVGTILLDSTTIDFTYDNSNPSITAIVKPNSITPTELANNINLTEFINDAGFENTAQLNTRDVNNRNRINHTGVQAISTVTNLQSTLDLKEVKSDKNAVNGYAGLGSDGKIFSNQLPSIAITDTFVVSNQAAMLALVAETGDIAVRTDLTKTFILKGTNPSVLSDWQELLSPTDSVLSVFGRTGTVVANSGDYNTSLVPDTLNKRYVTDANLVTIGNQSGTNTGDETTSSIQSKRPIKTINSISLEGLGNVVISTDMVIHDYAKSSKGLIIGDSTIAAYAGGDGIETFLLEPADVLAGSTILNQAVPGNTIDQQLTIYNADANKATYDWIIVQIGLNDILPTSETATTVIARYQNLINTIYSTKKTGAKIIVSAMLPCKQRFIDLVGAVDGALAQQKWVDINNAIMGGGVTPVINVDFRNNDHVETLSDGIGNLAKAFCVTPIDNIHENNNGRYVIASAMRKTLAYADFFRPKTENKYSKYFTNVGRDIFLKEGVLKIDSRLNTGDYSLYLKNSNNGADQYTQMSYEIMTTDGSTKQTFSTGVGNYSNGTVLAEKYYLFYNDFLGSSHFLFHVNKNGDFTNYGAIFAPRISVSSPNSDYAGFFEKTAGFGSSLALKNSSTSSASLLRFLTPADVIVTDVTNNATNDGLVFSGTISTTGINVTRYGNTDLNTIFSSMPNDSQKSISINIGALTPNRPSDGICTVSVIKVDNAVGSMTAIDVTTNKVYVRSMSSTWSAWVLLIPETNQNQGVTTLTLDGSSTVYTIPHGLGVLPSYADGRRGTSTNFDVYNVTWDATNIILTYQNPPTAGSLNINWIAFK